MSLPTQDVAILKLIRMHIIYWFRKIDIYINRPFFYKLFNSFHEISVFSLREKTLITWKERDNSETHTKN